MNNYREKFAKLTDYQVVQAFNNEVNGGGWTAGRAYYLQCLKEEFDERGINWDILKVDQGFSLKHKVTLIEGRLELLQEKQT